MRKLIVTTVVAALLSVTSIASANHAAYPELRQHARKLQSQSARLTDIISQDFRTALLYRQMIDRSIELEQRSAKLRDLAVHGGSYGNIMAEIARIQGDVSVLNAWVRDSVFRAEHGIDPLLPVCAARAGNTIANTKETICCARESAKAALHPPVVVVPHYEVRRAPVVTTQVVVRKNFGRPNCSVRNQHHGHHPPSMAGFGFSLNYRR